MRGPVAEFLHEIRACPFWAVAALLLDVSQATEPALLFLRGVFVLMGTSAIYPAEIAIHDIEVFGLRLGLPATGPA
jgi:hypothetical protein